MRSTRSPAHHHRKRQPPPAGSCAKRSAQWLYSSYSMKREDFHRWFNRDFWKAFKSRAFPIKIPQTQNEKNDLVEKIYSSISSARYAPSIPEAEIVVNKGPGVARTVPVFCMEDYCVY